MFINPLIGEALDLIYSVVFPLEKFLYFHNFLVIFFFINNSHSWHIIRKRKKLK